jgi:uncharacterized protein
MEKAKTAAARKIRIRAGQREIFAELDNSVTAQRIFDCLPCQATANLWGDEIYFTVPVECCETNMQEVVAEGDIGYWPPGDAMCLFFGPTPASRGDEIRPASKVHVFGRLVGDLSVLRHIPEGERLILERVE